MVWLREFLPHDIPDSRILTYGYDSAVKDSICKNSIQDYSTQFLEAIDRVRDDEVRSRST